jgi:mRNA-degrading endonuclease RelE of RelBE toxin-antitoxin system
MTLCIIGAGELMEFRIADTFTDSLAKLAGDEQKAVKTAAFDLQLNPAHPSMQFHKLERPKDRRFWSIRVSSDVRLIVHRTGISLLLCYVGHHDDAYHWAERRKLETHPKTGAAQFVEVRETVQEILVPKYVEVAQASAPKPRLFAEISKDDLLGFVASQCWELIARRRASRRPSSDIYWEQTRVFEAKNGNRN